MFRKKEQISVNQYVIDNFSNADIEEKLLNMDIGLFEDAIEKEQSRFVRLQDLKREGELDFGLKPEEIDLGRVYFDLKRDITSLLGVSPNIPDLEIKMNTSFNFPAVGSTIIEGTALFYVGLYSLAYLSGIVDVNLHEFSIPAMHVIVGDVSRRAMITLGSMYDPKKNKMMLGRNPEAVLIPTVAHEFDHHALHKNGVPYGVFSGKNKSFVYFHEGHAQGVQRVVSKQHFEQTGNDGYLYGSSKIDLVVLKKTYKWYCKKNDQKPKTTLATGKIFKGINKLFYYSFDSSERHVKGSAFFYLLEQEQGNSVYKNTLRDPAKVFSFNDL